MTPTAGGPIGVFDSGIGGLTVYKALRDALPPAERLIYLGDTARVPYGTRSDATVVRYALEGGRFLVRRGIKALVVACNTMSAVALDELCTAMGRPVVGVIEPGVEAACRATRGGVIGVIGTAATIKSGAYPAAIARRRPEARVVTRACPLFVPLAEEGWVDNEVARATARAYLGDLRGAGIDTLVLGCTHYPLLKPLLSRAMGPGVTLVDSAEETAKAVAAELDTRGLLAAGGSHDHLFVVSDDEPHFRKVGARFLGEKIKKVEVVPL